MDETKALVQLSTTGITPPPMPEEAFELLGQQLTELKQDPDFKKIFKNGYKACIKHEKTMVSKQVDDLIYEFLAKEFSFRGQNTTFVGKELQKRMYKLRPETKVTKRSERLRKAVMKDV